jgi:L-threonylcarbamoyladenylate synthase
MSQVDQAIKLLRENQVIGLPTETVYGLAGRIGSEDALKMIFAVKERPFFDPLIVHIGKREQLVDVVAEWPPLAEHLANEFWPGPLTIVLPKAAKISSLITSGLETVAVRMPRHSLALEVLAGLGEPVAAPSANKFGKTSPTSAEHVRQSFAEVFVLDGGPAEVGLESTVVSIQQNSLTILRPGAVTEEMLKKFGVPVTRATSSASPGHLEHHYMPDVPLRIFSAEQAVSGGHEIILSLDPVIAARELYAKLRSGAELKPEFLFIRRQELHHGGLWEAIWDRLGRAKS